jgi:putative ABC transport system permease protein
MALRASLGATRGRLVRQLLVESLILASLGGAGGVLFTQWATTILPIFLPAGIPALAPAGTVFLFASGLSLFSVLAAGLLPAWKSSRRNLNNVIKGESAQPGGRLRRIGTRQLLVTAEVATAFVLLVAAGLLIKSFSGLRSMDTGFEAENLLTVRVDLPEDRYEEAEAQLAFLGRLTEDLREGIPPQMATITVASGLVENLEATFQPLMPEGTQGQDEAHPQLILTRRVDTGYFRTLGLPILQGRDFSEADEEGDETVVIINEAVARQYFPAGDAVGKRLYLGEDRYRVLAVSGIIHLPILLTQGRDLLQLFFPIRADPSDGFTVVARVVGDPGATVDRVKEIIRRIDPTIPVQKIAMVDELLADALNQEKSNSLLMGLFALSALVLGALGIYGVVAYSVSRRIREMGIRVALGASKGGVVAQVVLGGMKTVAGGIALGALGALAMGATLSRLLHEVDPRDPQVFALVTAVITGVALAASWLPARRAAGSEPLDSLKSE